MSPEEKNNNKNILVIKLGALGDFIQALGPMAAIRRHHPNAHITLLTTKTFVSLGESCGYFNSILIDKKPAGLDLRGWFSLRKKLNNKNFDRVYDLQNNDRTSIYLKLFSRKQKPEWVGAAHGASHRNTSPERTKSDALSGHKQTLALAGIKDVETDTMEWADSNTEKFHLAKPYIILVPGSTPERPEKRWPAAQYGLLAKTIKQKNIQPVVIGTNQESDLAAIICKLCPETVDLTGQTSLLDLAAIARQAISAIGNDTGPMHVIAATKCPSIILFSKYSNPERHAPRGTNVKTITSNELNKMTCDDVLQQTKEIIFPA